jgi:hypothetical protein
MHGDAPWQLSSKLESDRANLKVDNSSWSYGRQVRQAHSEDHVSGHSDCTFIKVRAQPLTAHSGATRHGHYAAGANTPEGPCPGPAQRRRVWEVPRFSLFAGSSRH